MKLKNLTPLVACLTLSGCIAGAAADLAATTIVTAGKLAVKDTGAVTDTVTPDGDDKRKEDKKKQEKAQRPEARQTPPLPCASTQIVPTYIRYIMVDADDNVVEERDTP